MTALSTTFASLLSWDLPAQVTHHQTAVQPFLDFQGFPGLARLIAGGEQLEGSPAVSHRIVSGHLTAGFVGGGILGLRRGPLDLRCYPAGGRRGARCHALSDVSVFSIVILRRHSPWPRRATHMLVIVYNLSVIDGYMTTNQASANCGLSQAHIRRLLEMGTIVGVKAGHDWLVRVDSLGDYMRKRPKPGRRAKRSHDAPGTTN